MEYFSGIKNEILSFAVTWMELDISKLSDKNKIIERQVPHVLSHLGKLRGKVNLSVKW